MRHTILILSALFLALPTWAQYSPAKGQNAPSQSYEARRTRSGNLARDDDGQVIYDYKKKAPKKDRYGNAQGNQYDLAVDGAFEGQTVLVVAEYPYALTETIAALKKKGFSTVVYRNGVPDLKTFKSDLEKSCQVWVISNSTAQLTDGHIAAIKTFFDAGHGVFIWGDNDPFYADANRVAQALVPGMGMHGNLPGNIVVEVQSEKGTVGVAKGHLITTGLTHLFEGITIATMHFDNGKLSSTSRADWGSPKPQATLPNVPQGFTPILVGSAGNLVSVAYEQNGKRLMLDGGFTRLKHKWDDAGTARFVKNAAAWLVNSERFKDKVATNVSVKKKTSTSN